MNRVRTKICGITRPEEAKWAAEHGADAIGLVFFAKSKRCVQIEQAQNIVQALPPFVSVVGLFVNESKEKIETILSQVPIDVLQFHGDESAAFCRQFARPYLKAIRVKNQQDIDWAMQTYTDARAILFDAYVEGEYGGTGQQFNWAVLPQTLDRPWILAGGLTPDNVQIAIKQTGAECVDVSGGVEAENGRKSLEKIRAFLHAVQNLETV